MSNPKISICIVTFNNQDKIKDTIESLLPSLEIYGNYEFYIVDNGSTDETLNIIANFKKIIIIKSINKGFGFGHNQILDIIKSKYHFIVNPDIKVLDLDFFIESVNFLENEHSIGLMTPLILNPDYTIQFLNKRNPTVFDMFIRFISPNLFKKRQDRFTMKDIGYDSMYSLEFASGCFMIFRTEIFKKIQGFDEKFFMYLEDADITRRVNLISRSIFNPNIRILHFWERSGHKKLKYIIITIKSMIYYFKKWR